MPWKRARPSTLHPDPRLATAPERMMPNITRLLSEILHLPDDALVYEASRRLHELFPDKFILETEDYDFDIAQYIARGKCMIHMLDDSFGHCDTSWHSTRGVQFKPMNGYFEVQWRGTRFYMVSLTYDSTTRHFIITDSRHLAVDFFSAVCRLEVDASGEILVFRNGYWRRDSELRRQIATASLDDVVLPASLRDDLLRDVEGFFASKELYEKHGLAWKRGLLLLGNPGNGKTLTIKALINRLAKPCLYVRSFDTEKMTVDRTIASVFQRAREVAPCILVMEDLDSLVDEDNLSPLLNELDGFAANSGVLTIATTNHPEDLDPALLNRPSRFDLKIEFKDPGVEERLRFLSLMNVKREGSMRLSEDELMETAKATEGFSFAFLKELNVSAMTASLVQGISMGEAMRRTTTVLQDQVSGEPNPKAKTAKA